MPVGGGAFGKGTEIYPYSREVKEISTLLEIFYNES